MCGIFGFVSSSESGFPAETLGSTLSTLFRLSETRGKESSGLAVQLDGRIAVHKDALSASRMLSSPSYKRFLGDVTETLDNATESFAVTGHTRLVTNGEQAIRENNQPVDNDGCVVVHNGIIVTDERIWSDHPEMIRGSEVDTEILPAMVQMMRRNGETLEGALRNVFSAVEGEVSVAMLFSDLDCLVLATNTGSLYLGVAEDGKTACFVSEDYILRKVCGGRRGIPGFANASRRQVRAGEAVILDLRTLEAASVSLVSGGGEQTSPLVASGLADSRKREIIVSRDDALRAEMKRCARCVLPDTMPFISFDEDGVCNYCRSYAPHRIRGRDDLEQRIAPIRRGDGGSDCLVALSGGRDSCYGLHLLRAELGMRPTAYTYDWGMVTDIARRNQARMCGELGVEHIWLSADINAKRANIRKNVEAWLRRPSLGMVPLFMAGDKAFLFNATRILNQTGLPIGVFCQNKLENTGFKLGFCGISPHGDPDRGFNIAASDKARLAVYYASEYVKNPKYINRSLADSLYNFARHDFLYLFDYLEWNEDDINDVLINRYGWETAKDTTSTWRIGDGTAPFYNYIYHTVAGFTENDTFRSNQIREGVITREEALKRIERENQPRWDSIKEYANIIGIDFNEFLRVVHGMTKLYDR